MLFEKIQIYRMTHIENIPHILRYGITNKSSVNANPNYKNIGDVNLISNRNGKIILVTNGNMYGFITSIKLGDFIPFYFGVRMPMLYVMQHGGNFVESATSPENIVYIVCNVKQMSDAGLFNFYFSDGHATSNLTSFFNKSKILDLPNIIDWDAVRAKVWDGEENLNKKRKKQAEFLVIEDIAPEFIIGLGCYNEEAKNKLIAMGVRSDIIKIIPNSYY